MGRMLSNGMKRPKRLIATVAGFTILLVGQALLVLPGPACVVLSVAFAVLSSEFAWARLLLRRVRKKLGKSQRPDEPRAEGKDPKGGVAP